VDCSYSKADLLEYKLKERTLSNHVLDSPSYDKEYRPPGLDSLGEYRLFFKQVSVNYIVYTVFAFQMILFK
jgi:hypothetical protein